MSDVVLVVCGNPECSNFDCVIDVIRDNLDEVVENWDELATDKSYCFECENLGSVHRYDTDCHDIGDKREI